MYPDPPAVNWEEGARGDAARVDSRLIQRILPDANEVGRCYVAPGTWRYSGDENANSIATPSYAVYAVG